ncbi:hypothetical protein O9929_16315 [Vibrio lentus]|nr:hypothetical protein [Vibrio lentus]
MASIDHENKEDLARLMTIGARVSRWQKQRAKWCMARAFIKWFCRRSQRACMVIPF